MSGEEKDVYTKRHTLKETGLQMSSRGGTSSNQRMRRTGVLRESVAYSVRPFRGGAASETRRDVADVGRKVTGWAELP